MTLESNAPEILGSRIAAFGHGDHDGLRASDVVVRDVASSGWRVHDDRMPERDAHSVLGFIEKRDGRFEVMQLGSGFRWSTFDTMDEAVSHLTHRLASDEGAVSEHG